MSEDTFKSGLSRAMALCSKRELSISEIRNKLLAWDIKPDEADRVIETLLKENFINEIRYSVAFARDKFNYNKWGRVKIASQLKARKINSGAIRSALAEIDDEKYISTLRNILISHRKSIKAKNQYDLKAKLFRYGLSKGFENDLLFDILGELDQE